MTAALIPWRRSVDEFARTLRRHGLDPAAVADVSAAWRAFGEFLETEIDGLVTEPNSDADGFIIQWGRNSWRDDNRLSISFTRQLAIAGEAADDGEDVQPDYWQLDLAMFFDDASELMLLDGGNEANTGFFFEPAGPRRAAALAAAEEYPQLQAALTVRPVESELTFYQVE